MKSIEITKDLQTIRSNEKIYKNSDYYFKMKSQFRYFIKWELIIIIILIR